MKHKQPATRRQFFSGVLRNTSLMFLGAGSGAAAVKRRRLLREGKCLNQGICSNCQVFKACGLPRALSVKLAMKRSRDGE
jgi:hypothetical protein